MSKSVFEWCAKLYGRLKKITLEKLSLPLHLQKYVRVLVTLLNRIARVCSANVQFDSQKCQLDDLHYTGCIILKWMKLNGTEA